MKKKVTIKTQKDPQQYDGGELEVEEYEQMYYNAWLHFTTSIMKRLRSLKDNTGGH